MAPLTGITPLNRTLLPCQQWRAAFSCRDNDSDGTCRLASEAYPPWQSKITQFNWISVCPAALMCFQASAEDRLPYSAHDCLLLNSCWCLIFTDRGQGMLLRKVPAPGRLWNQTDAYGPQGYWWSDHAYDSPTVTWLTRCWSPARQYVSLTIPSTEVIKCTQRVASPSIDGSPRSRTYSIKE
jgi:hypothetical protein